MKQTAERIKKLADEIRQDVILMVSHAGSGHVAGALGMADVFAVLYSEILRHDPKNPQWQDRDRLVLSNGHICPVLYATLAHMGYFPQDELMTLRDFGSRLQGHPQRGSLPGIETTSGPLGCGISQAVGMALASQLDNKKHDVWCIASDGEMDEGNTWEALMCAAKYRVNNLTVIIDRNNIQIDGFTENIMPLEPLKQKYESFGWHVMEIDGHNIQAIIDACHASRAIFQPVIIIAHTIPGKGVDFMEFDPAWHGKSPDLKETEHALRELRTLKGTVEQM